MSDSKCKIKLKLTYTIFNHHVKHLMIFDENTNICNNILKK